MAPPVSCSVERLQRFGWEAAKKMKRKEKMAHSVSLTCEYLGVCTGEGQFDAASATISSRTVGFEWRVKAGAHGHTQVVTVRCDNLGSRGVHFPRGWATALQLMDLDEIVGKTVERVIAQSKTSWRLLPAARSTAARSNFGGGAQTGRTSLDQRD
jgi:hypothetical protein